MRYILERTDGSVLVMTELPKPAKKGTHGYVWMKGVNGQKFSEEKARELKKIHGGKMIPMPD